MCHPIYKVRHSQRGVNDRREWQKQLICFAIKENFLKKWFHFWATSIFYTFGQLVLIPTILSLFSDLGQVKNPRSGEIHSWWKEGKNVFIFYAMTEIHLACLSNINMCHGVIVHLAHGQPAAFIYIFLLCLHRWGSNFAYLIPAMCKLHLIRLAIVQIGNIKKDLNVKKIIKCKGLDTIHFMRLCWANRRGSLDC